MTPCRCSRTSSGHHATRCRNLCPTCASQIVINEVHPLVSRMYADYKYRWVNSLGNPRSIHAKFSTFYSTDWVHPRDLLLALIPKGTVVGGESAPKPKPCRSCFGRDSFVVSKSIPNLKHRIASARSISCFAKCRPANQPRTRVDQQIPRQAERQRDLPNPSTTFTRRR